MKEITEQIEQSIEAKKQVMEQLVPQITQAIEVTEKALRAGNKIILAGNGGSASEASHIAAEFTGRYKLERKSLPAIALTTDISAVTAISNDYGYDQVFKRQLEGLGNKGDIFIAMSTSGNSDNLVHAMELAQKKGITVIGLIGRDGGKMKNVCDIDLTVPSDNTPCIQEAHLMITHIICEVVEQRMFA